MNSDPSIKRFIVAFAALGLCTVVLIVVTLTQQPSTAILVGWGLLSLGGFLLVSAFAGQGIVPLVRSARDWLVEFYRCRTVPGYRERRDAFREFESLIKPVLLFRAMLNTTQRLVEGASTDVLRQAAQRKVENYDRALDRAVDIAVPILHSKERGFWLLASEHLLQFDRLSNGFRPGVTASDMADYFVERCAELEARPRQVLHLITGLVKKFGACEEGA